MRWARFLFYPGLAPLAVGTVVLLALFGLFVLFLEAPDPVIGPTPEEIQEHCQPVIDWILSEMERSGRPPEQISSQHAARLNELPYSWRLEGSDLTIGKLSALGGEWPHPLYTYNWWPNQWWWWADHQVSEEEGRRILEGHGYYQREPPEAVGQ